MPGLLRDALHEIVLFIGRILFILICFSILQTIIYFKDVGLSEVLLPTNIILVVLFIFAWILESYLDTGTKKEAIKTKPDPDANSDIGKAKYRWDRKITPPLERKCAICGSPLTKEKHNYCFGCMAKVQWSRSPTNPNNPNSLMNPNNPMNPRRR